MEQLHSGKNCRASDLAAQWRVTEKTAKRDIADLKKKGLVRFVGPAKTGRYYFLDETDSDTQSPL